MPPPPQPVVLVTGSSGHLGTALMLALPSHGFTPIGIDILASPTTSQVVDITSPSEVAAFFQSHKRIDHVIHTATLHKPHVGSHTKADFLSVNLSGTLNLLEAASSSPSTPTPSSFIFISTTSAFGSALSSSSAAAAAAVWIDETVVAPRPKNIYGATKVAAEDLCYLIHKETGMPTLVLRTSRFFPEADDDEHRRSAMPDDENLKVCELAYRRVDIADVVSACVCAIREAPRLGYAKYIISAPPPPPLLLLLRNQETQQLLLQRLNSNAAAAEVMRAAVPEADAVFSAKGWSFLQRIDRIYDSSRAVSELGWEPQYTFARAVSRMANGEEWRSDLTLQVGKKGYHAVSTGVYTVRDPVREGI